MGNFYLKLILLPFLMLLFFSMSHVPFLISQFNAFLLNKIIALFQ